MLNAARLLAGSGLNNKTELIYSCVNSFFPSYVNTVMEGRAFLKNVKEIVTLESVDQIRSEHNQIGSFYILSLVMLYTSSN